MRIPYVPDPPPFTTAEDAETVARVRARRDPRPLQPLDLTLLHSPPVADGWNSFLGAIRSQTSSVPANLRELAVSRIAVVNRAWYEWGHHAPLAVAAGVSEEGMAWVRDHAEAPDERPPGLFGDQEWTVLKYSDEMTRNVTVRDETFEEMRTIFGERGAVEVTAVIACYNCVSRFLVALDVGEKNGSGPPTGPIGGAGH